MPAGTLLRATLRDNSSEPRWQKHLAATPAMGGSAGASKRPLAAGNVCST